MQKGAPDNLVKRRTQLFEAEYADPTQIQGKASAGSKPAIVKELEGKFTKDNKQNQNISQDVDRKGEFLGGRTGKVVETGKQSQYGVRVLPNDMGGEYKKPMDIMGKTLNSVNNPEQKSSTDDQIKEPVIWAHRIPNKLKINSESGNEKIVQNESNYSQPKPAVAVKRSDLSRISLSRKPVIRKNSSDATQNEPLDDHEQTGGSISDRINQLKDIRSKEEPKVPPPRPKSPVYSHGIDRKPTPDSSHKTAPKRPKGPPPKLPSRDKVAHLKQGDATPEIKISEPIEIRNKEKKVGWQLQDQMKLRHSYCDNTEFSSAVNSGSPHSPDSVTSPLKKKPDRPQNPPPSTPKIKQQAPPVSPNQRKYSLPMSPTEELSPNYRAVQNELNQIYRGNAVNINNESNESGFEVKSDKKKPNDAKKDHPIQGRADTGSIRIKILPKYKEDLSTNPVREVPLETGDHNISKHNISKPIQLNIPKANNATAPPKNESPYVTSPTRKPPPDVQPPKPPRTFKHEEYMEAKALKKANAQESSVSMFKPQNKDNSVVNDGAYEEVDVKRGIHLKANPPPRPTHPPPRNKVIQGTLNMSPRTKVVTEASGGALQGTISNPNYELHHEAIPIKTYTGQDGQLKRHKSDECLYAEPSKVLPKRGDIRNAVPIYKVSSLISPDQMDHHGIAFDQAGYAVPDIKGKISTLQRSGMTRSPSMAHRKFRTPAAIAEEEEVLVREKVSQVYSTVHLRRGNDVCDGLKPAGSSSSTDDDDSDSNIDMEEHRDRLNHMMAQKATYASVDKLRQRPVQAQMFTYSLIVSLQKDGTKYKPCVVHKFPMNGKDHPAVPEFCFPDPSLCKPVRRMESEMFSFVLTDAAGVRQYGYCRKMLPPGTKERLPEVICVVSPLDAYGFYRNFLREMEIQRQSSREQVEHVLECAFGRPLPAAGQEAWIRYMLPIGKRDTLCIRRPKDPRSEQVTFLELIKQLKTDILLKVFGSIILERRVILTSCRLSILSSCCHALVSLLYPFNWQHTYIPVLPRSLIDVCGSPAPFIVGLLTESLKDLDHVETEEVLIVDLDLCKLRRCQGDEDRLLPNRIKKALAMAVDDQSGTFTRRNLMISEAFLRFFVETCGHHIHFFTEQPNGTMAFQKEMFVNSPTTKSLRMFLECFCETQMFEVFIREKLDGTGTTTALFDDRVKDYQEEIADMGPSFRTNVRIFGKKMVNFMVESGGKIKKMFSARTEVT